ncbi:MAG TPA: rRNA maturation RNase YbeY [Terriglobia bacterium]|nr:rRNA maturation RNase YbeY [Terriglobia bacterium]
MIVNRQNQIRLDLGATRKFVGQLRKRLLLGRGDFNVCLVEDRVIAALNATYRGNAHPTDVLSFPWTAGNGKKRRTLKNTFLSSALRAKDTRRKTGRFSCEIERREFSNFLGDIVISVETARRNARMEGHSVAREIRWLILHGALHLLGYDHESDGGVMTELEHKLRARMKM